MSSKYLVIQTDVDDYYVECPTQEFFDRLCKCVPHTSEFRSWHSSDTPEGTYKQQAVAFANDDIARLPCGPRTPAKD